MQDGKPDRIMWTLIHSSKISLYEGVSFFN
jgi:hypothetical protein